MNKVHLRTELDVDHMKYSDLTALICVDESRTLQSHAEEADINTLVKRFGLTGVMPQGVRAPTFADFEDVGDFQEAMDAVVTARNSFMAMPAGVRSRFGNDPQAFVEYCSNADNAEEMVKMGLIRPLEAVKLDPVVETLKEIRDEQRKGSGKSGSAS